MPNRRAASAPRTTVGSREDAASRKRPSASSAETTSSTDGSAAATRMPPVTDSSTRWLRRTVASTAVMPAASVTGPTRAAVSRADSGSVVESPNAVRPGATRSRSVPRASSWARTSARLDAEMPTTATIAAMPMAMPSAVSIVRDRRARSPMVPTRNRSAARSRLREMSRSRLTRRPPSRRRPPGRRATSPAGGRGRRSPVHG